jgi:hypothetical protein
VTQTDQAEHSPVDFGDGKPDMVTIDEPVGQFSGSGADLDDALRIAEEPHHGGVWV